jgi:hypothetical protein
MNQEAQETQMGRSTLLKIRANFWEEETINEKLDFNSQ